MAPCTKSIPSHLEALHSPGGLHRRPAHSPPAPSRAALAPSSSSSLRCRCPPPPARAPSRPASPAVPRASRRGVQNQVGDALTELESSPTMAEAVVGQVVVKLSAALAKDALTFGAKLLWKEASALKGLFSKIRDSKAELESIQAYLQEAERFKDTDTTTAIFVGEIRGLAFQIEDVVDEFTYKLEEEKHGGFAAKTKKRLKHIKTWLRLAAKLQEIEAKLQDAKRRKKDYSVGRFVSAARSTNQALHFTRDEDLVGIEENRERLIRCLTGGGGGGGGDGLEQRRSKVTTVCGMPGVGKTTLVAHVYNTVKVDFDAAAWVTVSQSYCLEDLLKKIAVEFGVAVDVANIEMRGLAESIHNYLQGKKYILVLDDVWTARLWTELRNVFPTSDCTGRFVITSRKQEVSLLATRESAIHLEPLQEHHSWLLFCQGAFWNDDDKECPLELHKLAVKFIAKCQGLPIALACIGRLLSSKLPTFAEWENVYRCLDSQLVKDVLPDVDMILKVSMDDLPYDLKNCFLHCALFPEDYVLKRKMIMRQWIAAGFIREEEENRTLEEVAEGYLVELVNRSLLQVIVPTPRLCSVMHDFQLHHLLTGFPTQNSRVPRQNGTSR
ncbi:hypothetical protein ZWY2020_054189 [Hordeum vulgare]|nr:hypothetical protein ZWY2020_054189 [Hordeum vulgare]